MKSDYLRQKINKKGEISENVPPFLLYIILFIVVDFVFLAMVLAIHAH